MTFRQTILTSACSLIMASGALVRADDNNTAGIVVHSADQNVSQATQDVIAARREADYARINQSQAADAARSAVSSLDQLRGILDDPGVIERAIIESRAAGLVLEESSAKLREARVDLDFTSSAVEQYRSQLRSRFEESAAFTEANRQQDLAQDRLDNEIDLNLTLLGREPEYQRAMLYMIFTRQRVEGLRQDTTTKPDVLAAASKAWMDAQSEVGSYEQWWLDNDNRVAAARAAFTDARQNREILEARFEREVASQPQMAELIATQAAAQRRVAALATEVRTAADRQAGARENVTALTQQLDLARQQYANLQAELASTYNSLDSAAVASDHADQHLHQALDDRDRALLERDRALRDYQLSRDNPRFGDLRRDPGFRDRNPSDVHDATLDRDRDRNNRTSEFLQQRTLPNTTGSAAPPQTPILIPSPRPREIDIRALDQPRPADQVRLEAERANADRNRFQTTDDRTDDSRRTTIDTRDRTAGNPRPSSDR